MINIIKLAKIYSLVCVSTAYSTDRPSVDFLNSNDLCAIERLGGTTIKIITDNKILYPKSHSHPYDTNYAVICRGDQSNLEAFIKDLTERLESEK